MIIPFISKESLPECSFPIDVLINSTNYNDAMNMLDSVGKFQAKTEGHSLACKKKQENIKKSQFFKQSLIAEASKSKINASNDKIRALFRKLREDCY